MKTLDKVVLTILTIISVAYIADHQFNSAVAHEFLRAVGAILRIDF